MPSRAAMTRRMLVRRRSQAPAGLVQFDLPVTPARSARADDGSAALSILRPTRLCSVKCRNSCGRLGVVGVGIGQQPRDGRVVLDGPAAADAEAASSRSAGSGFGHSSSSATWLARSPISSGSSWRTSQRSALAGVRTASRVILAARWPTGRSRAWPPRDVPSLRELPVATTALPSLCTCSMRRSASVGANPK